MVAPPAIILLNFYRWSQLQIIYLYTCINTTVIIIIIMYILYNIDIYLHFARQMFCVSVSKEDSAGQLQCPIIKTRLNMRYSLEYNKILLTILLMAVRKVDFIHCIKLILIFSIL